MSKNRLHLKTLERLCDDRLMWQCYKSDVWKCQDKFNPSKSYYSNTIQDNSKYLGEKYCIKFTHPNYAKSPEMYIGNSKLEVMRKFYDYEILFL